MNPILLPVSQRRSSFPSSTVKDTIPTTLLTPLSLDERRRVWDEVARLGVVDLDIPSETETLLNPLPPAVSQLLALLEHTKEENNRFISDAEDVLKQVDALVDIHNSVTSQTGTFQKECTNLVDELSELEVLYKDLNDQFQHFHSLESIVKTLNKNNNSEIVLKSSFHDKILVKLDECIAFVDEPRCADYKDIRVYRFRFTQCMIRALSLIRNYLVTFIRSVGEKITTKTNNANLSNIVIDALVYKDFTDNMENVYNLFVEIYKRTNGNDDYFNLLDDVYNQYFKTRGSLIMELIIQPHLRETNANFNRESLINMSNTSLKFFVKILEKEFEIFQNLFFLPPTEINEMSDIDNSMNLTAVHKFFESSLLDPLYYLLRNKILKESDIKSLCELINLLKSYSVFNIEDGNFEFQINRINFDALFKPILEDAQTRLIFIINRYVEVNIVNYKKTGKELIISNKEVNDDILSSNQIYPPIVKSIEMLTQIYQSLNQAVFDDITSSIVHLTLLSMENNFITNNTIEYKLYQIKSLLPFRDYINTFEIEHARKETVLDFSPLKSLYSRFTNQPQETIELNSNEHQSFFDRILGVIPKVINDYVDCRVELQIEIRNIVHQFIKLASNSFVDTLSTMPSSISKILDLNQKLISNIQNEIPRLQSLIDDYINDTRVKTFLLDGIQEEFQTIYKSFHERLLSEKSSEGDIISQAMEPDDINRIWAETVRKLLRDDDNEVDVDDNMILRDVQQDIDNLEL